MNKMGRPYLGLASLAIGAFVAGCTSVTAGSGAADVSTPLPSPKPTTVSIGAQRLTMTLPAGGRLSTSSTTSSDGQCNIDNARLVDRFGTTVAIITLPPDTCPHHGGQAINGDFGKFIIRQDVAHQPELQQHAVKAGLLASFTEQYTECTNSCKVAGIDVAVIFLDHPADRHHAVINIFNTADFFDAATDFSPAGLAATIQVH